MIGRWVKVRIAMVGLAFAVLTALLGHRAFELQVRDADRMTAWAEDNYVKEIQLPPHRGRILDRHGNELATSVEVDSVFCNPRQLAATADGASRLGKAVGLEPRELARKLEGHKYFAWVKRRAAPAEAVRALALGIPGVGVRKELARVYSYGALGGTVLGHADTDGRGVEGAELAFDRELRGSAVEFAGIKDALGRELLVDGFVDQATASGNDVVLTLDKFLTYTTEKALGAAVTQHHAKAGVAVMLDPGTGEILALANVPNLDPGDAGNASSHDARNRAVTDLFEPGSTMKTFTFAAALDAGKVQPSDLFDCQLGTMAVGKFVIHDDHPQGILSAAEVYKHSSNIGTVKIARRIGPAALAAALARFGFGRITGVGLPGERAGIVRPVAQWGEAGFTTRAYGQGLSVTPLQIVAGYGAVASGGIYRAPRIALRALHPGGQVVTLTSSGRPDERVMSESAARTLLGIMRGVVEDGTGKAAAIPGYAVGGKTGTAIKVVGGRYDKDRYVASFIGAVPLGKPRLVIGVFIDEPQPIHYGGVVAAPVFKEIGEAALRYLGVPPSEPIVASARAERKGERVALAFAEGPGSEEPALPLQDDLVEDSVEAEAGESAALALRQVDGVTIPDFTGLSMGEAIGLARKTGVELLPEGSGIASTQTPSPGWAPRGALCRVSFRPGG